MILIGRFPMGPTNGKQHLQNAYYFIFGQKILHKQTKKVFCKVLGALSGILSTWPQNIFWYDSTFFGEIFPQPISEIENDMTI